MSPDPRAELRFALEEGHADAPPAELAGRVASSARRIRPPGRPTDAPPRISGAETFRRAVAAMDAMLADLDESDWVRPALRDLDVQGLLGHLMGVEATFIDVLSGQPRPPADDHVASTQPFALAQAGQPAAATVREWQRLTSRTSVLVSAQPVERPVAFYGVELPLDQLLVIRAFEMWIHEEDIRRATSRPLQAPGPATLARMADLAVTLLPGGLARAGLSHPGHSVRLVLTGPAGGTWNVSLDGSPAGTDPAATVVVDTTTFCRMVSNRLAQSDSGAWIDGDTRMAADVFVGAAALALD